jgi:WD40 repeat protein
LAWLVAVSLCSIASADPAAVSFSKQIAPILVDQCIGCHNEKKKEGGYSLATFDLLLQGSDRGKAIEPGKPQESILSQMLHGTEDPAMPFETDPLPPDQITLIDQWIAEGASFDGADRSVAIRDLVLNTPSAKGAPNLPPPIAALAFRPDGQLLAVSGYHEITFWNPAKGELVSRLRTRSERIQSISWNLDGSLLLYAGGTPSRLGEVVLINQSDPSQARILHQSSDMILSAVFRPAGSHVAAAGTDRIFRIWETASAKEISLVENHADWVLALAYSPDGTKLLSASRDRSVKVWDQEKQEPLVTFSKHTDSANSVAVAPDNLLACSVGNDRIVRLWKLDGSAEQVREIAGHGDSIQKVLWSKSKGIIITAANDKRIIAWNPGDGALVREFAGSTDFIYALAFNADETRLAAAGFDGYVRIYNVDNAELLQTFLAIPSSPPTAAHSPVAGQP